MEKELFISVMTVLLWLVAIMLFTFIAFKMFEEFKRWNKKRLKIKDRREKHEALRKKMFEKKP